MASEAAPFVKAGGLGEVICSLPKALRALNYDARTIVPKYATIDAEKFLLEPEIEGIRPISGDKDPYGLLVSNVLKHRDKRGRTTAYFVENMEYYEKRANVYGYNDDTIRWVLLSKATLEFIKKSEWKPDIIVASDWQAGFVPNLIKTDYKDDPDINKIKVVFSIHNLHFQSMLGHDFVPKMDFDAGQAKIPDFFDKRILKLNGMRRGIMCADIINTVSPTYAQEILRPEFGEKLDDLLNERRSVLSGILNGIDVGSWNPATDEDIAVKYSLKSLKKKEDNKTALQKYFGLPVDKDKFVLGVVSRMDEQKGFGLMMEVTHSLLQNVDFQLVIVGEGDSSYRNFFADLQKKYPDKVAGHYFFDVKLPRLIFAGADAILIPSRFEPSGLVQLEAMRYGAIPIVHKVGGLADSVEDYVAGKNRGTGFVFKKYDKYAFLIAVIRAAETFRNKKEWLKLVKRAMAKDFSWKNSAKEYVKLFDLLLKPKKNNEET